MSLVTENSSPFKKRRLTQNDNSVEWSRSLRAALPKEGRGNRTCLAGVLPSAQTEGHAILPVPHPRFIHQKT